MLSPDVDAFTRATVDARGVRARSDDYPRILSGGLAGAAIAIIVGYALIVLVLTPLLSAVFDLPGRYPPAGPVLAYTAIAAIGLLGILTALKALLAGRPAVHDTLTRAALLVPLAAAAAAAAANVTRSPGYTTTEANIYKQIALVAVPSSQP